MSSRKRKNSPIPVAENNPPNKRAKLLSKLWTSQEDTTEISKKVVRREGILRGTPRVIKEQPKQYIINWQARQDLTVEGETHQTSRVSG